MILHIATLLSFQLIGEVISRLLFPILPGPVLGLVFLLVFLIIFPRAAEAIRPTTNVLLAHLSLLFVPAGVGIVGHFELISTHGPAVIAALVLSTLAAIAVGATVFAGVAHLLGQADD